MRILGMLFALFVAANASAVSLNVGVFTYRNDRQLFGRVPAGSDVPVDLRGKYLTATNTRAQIVGWAKPPQEQSHQSSVPRDTSEFSNAVVVQ